MHRSKGEFLLERDGDSGMKSAEACFGEALAIARFQGAKTWELRASISLARLWQRQGRLQDAGKVLSPIYHSFTQGFDLKDLQEAKRLLNVLA